MGDEKAVLSAEEVAKILGICQALVYRQIRVGNIPSVRLGDRYLIPKAAFERWLSCNQPIASELSGDFQAQTHTGNKAN